MIVIDLFHKHSYYRYRYTKNGPDKCANTDQALTTNDSYMEKSIMANVNTSSTAKTSPIFNAPRIQRRFSYFRAQVEISPASHVARDVLVIERRGYSRKGKQWAVSLVRGFEVRPLRGEKCTGLSRLEAKAKIAEFKSGVAAEVEGGAA